MTSEQHRDARTIPSWERLLSAVVLGLGVATIVLAILTVALVLYAKFGDPSSAGAIIGPGVGTLVIGPVWISAWALRRAWRRDDQEFYERLHGRQAP